MKENLKIINSSDSNGQLSEKSIERIKQANLNYEYLSSQVDTVSKKNKFKKHEHKIY